MKLESRQYEDTKKHAHSLGRWGMQLFSGLEALVVGYFPSFMSMASRSAYCEMDNTATASGGHLQ